MEGLGGEANNGEGVESSPVCAHPDEVVSSRTIRLKARFMISFSTTRSCSAAATRSGRGGGGSCGAETEEDMTEEGVSVTEGGVSVMGVVV
ncbi:hypothetical protein SESBI_27583 [Sesbania bispinosa]|nr:hypothetical protein SESBI_27583 [Sesbania bispinosa]